MKANCKRLASWLLGWVVVVSIGLTGCRKDEPTPEIVENPLDKEVYYIAGKVLDGNTGLEGVKVSVEKGEATTTSADGTFQLSVTQKGTYSVTFSKSGYVTITSRTTVSKDLKKSSIVSLVQQLTSTAQSVRVKPDCDTTVFDNRKPISVLHILANAVTKETDITVSEYLDGIKDDASHVSLSTINCLPDGQRFEKTVEVTVKNATSPAIYFSEVNHYMEKNGIWQFANIAPYDKNRNVYVSTLNSFSNHSFGFKCSMSELGNATEDLDLVVIDNMGNMKMKEQPISVKLKAGWMIEGDLKQLIKNRFTTLSASDVESLAVQLENAIGSTKGCASGISEISCSQGTAKLSGDMKVTIETKNRKTTTTILFRLNYQGQEVTFGVNIITYRGVATSITTQYGESHTDHSGSVIS